MGKRDEKSSGLPNHGDGVAEMIFEVRRHIGTKRSVAWLARETGIPRTTLSETLKPSWDPKASTLDLCVRAVRKDSSNTRGRREGPVSVNLPSSQIDNDDYRMFGTAMAYWEEVSGVALATDIQRSLMRGDLIGNATLARVGEDARLYLIDLTLPVWGGGYRGKGQLVADQPDRDFAAFAEQRLWQSLLSGEPLFTRCRTWICTDIGEYFIPYAALILPFKPGRGLAPTLALSIRQLEPSPYRIARLGR